VNPVSHCFQFTSILAPPAISDNAFLIAGCWREQGRIAKDMTVHMYLAWKTVVALLCGTVQVQHDNSNNMTSTDGLPNLFWKSEAVLASCLSFSSADVQPCGRNADGKQVPHCRTSLGTASQESGSFSCLRITFQLCMQQLQEQLYWQTSQANRSLVQLQQ